MGINLFVLIIIIASIIITNIKENIVTKKIEYSNIPIVTFNNSTLYIIDDKQVTQIISSSQALSYHNRDELYDATILIKNKYNKTNTISAEYMLKDDFVYKLYQNVQIRINTRDKIILNSDFMEYDTRNNILTNNKPFELLYNNNILNGENLFYNNEYNIIKAKNTHFKIKKEQK
jgi:hypothetical protein